jgi:ABC-type multidrug transport system fused ATPase/permease subunit
MELLNSLRQVLTIFYRHGGKKLNFIFISQAFLLLLELSGLFFLYKVMNALFQQLDTITIPFFNEKIPIFWGVCFLIGIYLFKAFYAVWQSRFVAQYCYDVNYQITANIIKHFYSQPTESFRKNPLADALNKVFTIGGYFSETIFQSIILLFSEGLLVIFILTGLFFINFKLLLLLLAILLPPTLLLLYFSRNRLREKSKNLIDENVQFHQTIMTLLHGLTDIKLSGQFNHFYSDFNQKIKQLHESKKVILFENGLPQKLLEFISVVAIATLYFVSFYGQNLQNLPTLLAAFAAAAFRLIPSLNRIIGGARQLTQFQQYIQFTSEIPITTYEEHQPDISENFSIDSLKLENVSYSFGEHPVLKNISLQLKKSSIYGITGESGAGKTTLINLLIGFLENQQGNILFNEKPLDKNTKNTLIHSSAFVRQDPYFLNASITENVVFGFGLPNIERVVWCLEAVNLQQWVLSKTSKYDTVIGDNGQTLSGGEKQRLAIARALYRKAKVLILDEPSNSLDAENKQKMLTLVKDLTRKESLITIIITHDSQVMNICDDTYILSKGELL